MVAIMMDFINKFGKSKYLSYIVYNKEIKTLTYQLGFLIWYFKKSFVYLNSQVAEWIDARETFPRMKVHIGSSPISDYIYSSGGKDFGAEVG